VYLLDTNIVSLLDQRRQARVPELVAWLRRNGGILFLSVISLAEMETGVLKLRREDKHARADELDQLIGEIEAAFADRTIPVTSLIARRLAHIGARIFPRSIGWPDLVIAATAEVNGLVILTNNIRHFGPTGVPSIDPLAELPPDTKA
jgi:predicted nucleic acid-binding protein